MKAYVIYQGEILDPEQYEVYKKAVAANIQQAGGRYLVRGGKCEALEGEAPQTRTVILEFPSKQAVLDWYRSNDYAEIRKLRDGAANATLYVVEGID